MNEVIKWWWRAFVIIIISSLGNFLFVSIRNWKCHNRVLRFSTGNRAMKITTWTYVRMGHGGSCHLENYYSLANWRLLQFDEICWIGANAYESGVQPPQMKSNLFMRAISFRGDYDAADKRDQPHKEYTHSAFFLSILLLFQRIMCVRSWKCWRKREYVYRFQVGRARHYKTQSTRATWINTRENNMAKAMAPHKYISSSLSSMSAVAAAAASYSFFLLNTKYTKKCDG